MKSTKTSMNVRKIISLFLTVSLIIGLLPMIGLLGSPVSAKDEKYYTYDLVWSPNLVGATNTTPTARNYIRDSAGNLLGFITGSSTASGAALSINGDKLVYTNTGSSNMPLRIVTGGNGWSSAGGFTPANGEQYLLEFNATGGSFTFSKDGAASNRDKDPAVPVSGTTYERIIDWPNGAAGDGSHGTAVIGMCTATGSSVTFSNFKIYKVTEKPPVPCEYCSVMGCRGECQVGTIAEWNFTAANYPTLPVGKDVAANVMSLTASGGLNKGTDKLVRNKHSKYPDGTEDDDYDNTNTMKHMSLKGTSGSNNIGWLLTAGWSTPDNHISLELNTTGHSNLVLKYDIRASSNSTPGELRLQYSLNGTSWKTLKERVSTRGSNGETGVVISREEHLPAETYNKPKVYFRWYGMAGSTSGYLEFKDIVLEKRASNQVTPMAVDDTIFSHVTITVDEDAQDLRFSWFTPKGYSTTNPPKFQYIKASQLNNGTMPAGTAVRDGELEKADDYSSPLYDRNKITVYSLEPNTEYAYRVGDGSKWGEIYRFKTQNPDSDYSVLVVADPQVNSSASNWKRTMKNAISKKSDYAFMLDAGDHMSNCNNYFMADLYLSPPELTSYPVASAYGNHDHSMAKSFGSKLRYLPLMYNFPSNKKTVTEDDDRGHDYYFKYGNALYIVLDSNIKTTSKHDSIMTEAIGKYPDVTWRVLLYHHDIYGGGDHANPKREKDGKAGDANRMQSDWYKFVDKYPIDVVFNGHDHIYVRSKLMKGNKAQTKQMAAIFNQDVSTTKNPSAIILPDGTQFMSLATPGDKFYDLQTTSGQNAWIGYGEPTQTSQYTDMRVEKDSVIMTTYMVANDGTQTPVETVTLRKKAQKEDLVSVLLGAKASSKYGSTPAYKSVVDAAQAIANDPSAPDGRIHNVFVSVYKAYDGHYCAKPGHKCSTCKLDACAHVCADCGASCNDPNCPICTHNSATCTLHICALCNRTCTLHICTICNRTCPNLPHKCADPLCNRTTPCSAHVCSTCGTTCPNLPHKCADPLCNRTTPCSAHVCSACGTACPNLPHKCTNPLCNRTTPCSAHICDICGTVCTDPNCTICNSETAYVELTNPSVNKSVITRGMYLSDSGGDPCKWKLPARIIRPNESVTFVGKNIKPGYSFSKGGLINYEIIVGIPWTLFGADRLAENRLNQN